MSGGIKLKSDAGGSVTLEAPAGLATDEVVEIEAGHGIKNGSDQRGNWVQFPDGTQICYGRISAKDAHENDVTKVVYPVGFVGVPVISVTPTSEGGIYAQWHLYDYNSTSFDIYTKDTNSVIDYHWQAIGRWK